MKIVSDLTQWRRIRRELPPELTLGFVPTMGNLHGGHASLLEASKADNECTVASLFINPKQFNQLDDFIHYPRTLEEDIELLTQVGIDYCLMPKEDALYADAYHYQLHENHLSLLMEGAARPGHFNGVLTVVMKLLQLVKPHRAYFGEKDHQQLQLVDGMVKAFFLDTTIIPCKTIREPSGLAKSSRNHRLTPEERQTADQFAHFFHQPNLSTHQLKDALEGLKLKLDYLQDVEGRRYVAVRIGAVRLIDNYALPHEASA